MVKQIVDEKVTEIICVGYDKFQHDKHNIYIAIHKVKNKNEYMILVKSTDSRFIWANTLNSTYNDNYVVDRRYVLIKDAIEDVLKICNVYVFDNYNDLANFFHKWGII